MEKRFYFLIKLYLCSLLQWTNLSSDDDVLTVDKHGLPLAIFTKVSYWRIKI